MLIGTANFQFVIVLYPKIIRIFVLYANLIHCPLKNRFNLLGGIISDYYITLRKYLRNE